MDSNMRAYMPRGKRRAHAGFEIGVSTWLRSPISGADVDLRCRITRYFVG